MDYKFGCVIEIDSNILNEPYILSHIDCEKFALISLIDGNRWSEPQYYSEEVKEEDLLFYLKVCPFNKVADSVEEYFRSLL